MVNYEFVPDDTKPPSRNEFIKSKYDWLDEHNLSDYECFYSFYVVAWVAGTLFTSMLCTDLYRGCTEHCIVMSDRFAPSYPYLTIIAMLGLVALLPYAYRAYFDGSRNRTAYKEYREQREELLAVTRREFRDQLLTKLTEHCTKNKMVMRSKQSSTYFKMKITYNEVEASNRLPQVYSLYLCSACGWHPLANRYEC